MNIQDDYQLTPCGPLGGRTAVSQYGKFIADFDTTEDALEFIKRHMETEQFWPSIVWVSDHGNYWPIDLDGNEIHDSGDDFDDSMDGDWDSGMASAGWGMDEDYGG